MIALAQFDLATLRAVGRASKRQSGVVRENLKSDLWGLATIACIAPWIGIFGTVVGIVNSFGGISGEKTALRSALCWRLSESLWPLGGGLLVGLIALWSYTYLIAKLEVIDLEMEGASLDLLNQLSRFPRRFDVGLPDESTGDHLIVGKRSLVELQREEKFERQCARLACVAFALTWCRWWVHVGLNGRDAILTACLLSTVIFVLSFFPAYPIWTAVLKRRRGTLIATASVICLSWSIIHSFGSWILP